MEKGIPGRGDSTCKGFEVGNISARSGKKDGQHGGRGVGYEGEGAAGAEAGGTGLDDLGRVMAGTCLFAC